MFVNWALDLLFRKEAEDMIFSGRLASGHLSLALGLFFHTILWRAASNLFSLKYIADQKLYLMLFLYSPSLHAVPIILLPLLVMC